MRGDYFSFDRCLSYRKTVIIHCRVFGGDTGFDLRQKVVYGRCHLTPPSMDGSMLIRTESSTHTFELMILRSRNLPRVFFKVSLTTLIEMAHPQLNDCTTGKKKKRNNKKGYTSKALKERYTCPNHHVPLLIYGETGRISSWKDCSCGK